MNVPNIPAGLSAAFSKNAVVAIVGSGFTSATAPGSAASSWISLIKYGAEVLTSRNPAFAPSQVIIDSLLELAADSNTNALLQAASMIRNEFNQNGPQSFMNFLHDTVGEIVATDETLGHSINKLKIPVLTTNYDSLLEQALDTDHHATWTNNEEMIRIIRGEARGVGHLHGVWTEPESVVFSTEDYAKLTASEKIVFGEASAFAMKTFMFIGMGEGVMDPNFRHIANYLKPKAGLTSHSHYLLCRSSQVPEFERKLAGSSIRPVAFGDSHADLPSFLHELARSTGSMRSRVDVEERSRKGAWSKIAEEINSNLLQPMASFDPSRILDSLVDPTFLPLSHEQYVHEKRKLEESSTAVDSELGPIEVDRILDGKKITIVVGEDHGGLTTTLQWLVLQYTKKTPQGLPVLLDSRSIRSQERLAAAIRKELNGVGFQLKRADELPEVILGIDNLSYRENEKFRTFCEDIHKVNAERVFIGCRLGEELEIARTLQSEPGDIMIVHLGKLGQMEIKKYAIIIAPNISSHMLARVFVLIRQEHLPRNPFTVTMILALMIQAASRPDLLQSQTDVLNEYMRLILSHAGGNLDARETLSVINLERVLMALAKEFVRNRSGALPANVCVDILQRLFEGLDWVENPLMWLERLKEMRILRNEGSNFSFRQSSYLYLYAAKAAVADAQFMQLMLAEPLFYAPIIKHCAALQRHNSDLVRSTSSLLVDWADFKHAGSVYKKMDHKVVIEDTDDDDESMDHVDSELPDEGTESEDSPERVLEGELASESYDLTEDTDILPFPLISLEQMTEASKLRIAVDLASNVLRDSDEIDDKQSKDLALLTALHSWGVLIDLMETDEEVREQGRRFIEDGVKLGFYSEEVAEIILPEFYPSYASFFVLNGIRENLRSKKLMPALERLNSSGSIEQRGMYAAAGAVFLEFVSRGPNWTTNILNLSRALEARWIVGRFVSFFMRTSYMLDELKLKELQAIEEFIELDIGNKFDFKGEKQRKKFVRLQINRLDKVRRMVMASRSIEKQKEIGN